jgi:tetratricopeptide (TPR) repeat protein
MLVFLTLSPLLVADEHHGHFNPNEKLGSVTFPISCTSQVKTPFERGVALLHSFWYEEADKQFAQVAQDDPRCAMAYWGQAMSLYHQLWNRPSAADVKRGAELVGKAKRIAAPTKREREYVAAVEVFYDDPAKFEFKKRASIYSKAMEKVYRDNPKDHEAGAFYALSLLASSDPDKDLELNAHKAIEILTPLFNENPEHPGLAHYLIHAADNPTLAPQGLEAAKKYASIAPSSPHALHMPGHIFARLGLWHEDIQSNAASVAAARAPSGMHIGAEHQVHAMDFLEYAYLQTGDNANAREMIEELKPIRQEDVDPGIDDYVNYAHAHFAAIYDLETRNWKAALNEQPVMGAKPITAGITYWARAVAAGHLRDAAAAGEAVKQYQALIGQTKKGPKPYLADSMKTYDEESRAWAAFAENKDDEAMQLMRSVADRQDRIGKGEVELPAREMVADMLLEMNRPEEALVEYEKALKSDPNRFNELYGAARAAEVAGQAKKAGEYFARLLKNCDGVASYRVELSQAKQLLAARSAP